MAYIECRDLTFTYPGETAPALRGVNLQIEAGAFFVLCGPSGGGKTTLLRLLKPALAPHGTQTGVLLLDGKAPATLPPQDAAAQIGYVAQRPQTQLVTDKVWHELAFGAESLGMEPALIRRRVAEMAAFFGIEAWFHKRTDALSGGQQQLLNLAAAMVLQPRVLLLDEPTAQLDPIAAETFLDAVQKVNRDLGVTIVLCEHRLEQALSMCDCCAVLEHGQILCQGDVRTVAAQLKAQDHPFAAAMPAATRVWSSVETDLPCPVTVNEGRAFLQDFSKTHPLLPIPEEKERPHGEALLCAEDVCFGYDTTPDVLRNFSLTAYAGELLCILGGNGSGKTTALRVLAGLLPPQRGTVQRNAPVALLPQDPTTLFLKKTLREDWLDALRDTDLSSQAREDHVAEMFVRCRLQGLEGRHPFDLSGGEQQRAALGKLVLRAPKILLLDEPTKGLDVQMQALLISLLRTLQRQGLCVVAVSHDVAFCARCADRCALLFDGALTATAPARSFFCGNRFYTTSARRMAQALLPQAVTTADVIAAVGGELPQTPQPDTQAPPQNTPVENIAPPKKPLPLWRKLAAAAAGAGALIALIFALKDGRLSEIVDAAGLTQIGKTQLLFYAVFLALSFLTLAFTAQKEHRPPQLSAQRKPTAGRLLFGAAVAVVMGATLVCGWKFAGARGFYFVALALLLEAMAPFFLRFERRRPQARELVLLAALCALNVAGRAAFFALPQFKPVLAMTVIVGVALGSESGFLVGAVTMLVSNVLFSQGPWTPWQMFAMGLVGALAGLFSRWGLLPRRRLPLAVFGAVSAVIIYGGILNPASALLWGGGVLNAQMLLSYYATGLPMDLVHAAASFLFLWVLAEPMLEKLDRVRVKYGFGET